MIQTQIHALEPDNHTHLFEKPKIPNRENKIDKRAIQTSVKLKVLIEQIREQVQKY